MASAVAPLPEFVVPMISCAKLKNKTTGIKLRSRRTHPKTFWRQREFEDNRLCDMADANLLSTSATISG